jgi:hypothetical protein
MPIIATPINDRLYGISMRPQELAVYGESVSFSLRYGPVMDDAAAAVKQHFKLLVLEIHADLPGNDALAQGKPRRLQLLKCGWELELSTADNVRTDELEEGSNEVPRLLAKVADTVNELARRAGLEAPLGPDVVTDLVNQYQLGLANRANGLQ